MFAAASDVDNTALIDMIAVKEGLSIMTFDDVAAFSQAPETELVFLWPPPEHMEKVGPCLWQCLKVREGRRKGARSWQDHFVEKLLSNDCPGNFKQSGKSPTIFHSRELNITMDVHIDDDYV